MSRPAFSRSASRRPVVAALVTAVVGATLSVGLTPVAASADSCRSTTGTLTVERLPAGSDVEACRAVGRIVEHDGLRLAVPEPGTVVGVEALGASGEAQVLQIEVSESGTISYPDEVTVGQDALTASQKAAADPSACADVAYTTNDLRVPETGYEWWVGDGSMPGGLSKAAARKVFADALDNITGTSNSCGEDDVVDPGATYQGTTSAEANISSASTCTARDETSTWDGGNLRGDHLALTCWWATAVPKAANQLVEADVRFNTTDYEFTNSPTSSCTDQYDIRSIATHEAGHVFGLGHVGAGHSQLTMYADTVACSTKTRTLGKGDVLGLAAIY